MKKTIFTLNIDHYADDVAKLTYPYMKMYADNIGADFVEINKRKFPQYPVIYEKFQIYELTKDNDWEMFVDADFLINPNLIDITEILPEDTVLTYGVNYLNGHYEYDNYFRRDGRNIGSPNFLTVASHLCTDIWEPLSDMTLEDAIKNIKMISIEKKIGYTPGHMIDDYVISRNIAKYGIKYKTFTELLNEIGRSEDEYFYHESPIVESEKVERIKKKLKNWKFA